MGRLFLKIFAIFWVAQSLIFVISTALIVRHRFPRPDALFDSLSASLLLEGQQAAAAYEQQGCAGFNRDGKHPINALLDGAGNLLCGSAVALPPPARQPTHLEGVQVRNTYVWSAPVVSASGRHYILQFSIPHRPQATDLQHELMHFSFPQLPVAIAISGFTTFLLTFLFTRPIVSLRRAARELAQGNLSTRVPEHSAVLTRGGQDEFQALIQDFNHMAARLESLVAAHKLLLRDVSHELRSPLARLGVAVELAHEDVATGNQQHLQRIEREADRLNQLIDQLLTLSSMEFIEERRPQHPLSLNHVLMEVIGDAAYEAQQHGCSVASKLGAEVTVLGDRELLHRALENIIRNAVRYTASGTVVEVSLNAAPRDHTGVAVVEVSDQGPGIPEDELNSVLKPFYRVDPARSRITGGFGIGLAITEKVIALHNGELIIENRREGGTRVRINLPTASAHG